MAKPLEIWWYLMILVFSDLKVSVLQSMTNNLQALIRFFLCTEIESTPLSRYRAVLADEDDWWMLRDPVLQISLQTQSSEQEKYTRSARYTGLDVLKRGGQCNCHLGAIMNVTPCLGRTVGAHVLSCNGSFSAKDVCVCGTVRSQKLSVVASQLFNTSRWWPKRQETATLTFVTLRPTERDDCSLFSSFSIRAPAPADRSKSAWVDWKTLAPSKLFKASARERKEPDGFCWLLERILIVKPTSFGSICSWARQSVSKFLLHNVGLHSS